MECVICGSKQLETVDTVISDFVMSRIRPNFQERQATKLCFCRECTFAFYAYRLTLEEEGRLYHNYRDAAYQAERERYECWYTKKVNDAINSTGTEEQTIVIENIVNRHVDWELKSALDYGGNKGASFTQRLGTEAKYVFDISGVETLPGITPISDPENLKRHRYDFIMCNMVFEHLSDPNDTMEKLMEIGDSRTIYYIEVPSENPFLGKNKFSIQQNLQLLFNRNYSPFRLVKYYFVQTRQPFMPMKEHVNFFSPQSIRTMVDRHGFHVLEVQENTENTPLGRSVVLSVLFKKIGERS